MHQYIRLSNQFTSWTAFTLLPWIKKQSFTIRNLGWFWISVTALLVIYFLIFFDLNVYPHVLLGGEWYIPRPLEDLTDLTYYIWSTRGVGLFNFYTTTFWPWHLFVILANLVVGNNQVLLQKIVLSAPLIGSIAMLILLKNNFKLKTIIAITGSILYSYGPYTLAFYGADYMWQMALLPLMVHYSIDAFYERKNTSLIKLALVVAFIPTLQIMLILPLFVISSMILRLPLASTSKVKDACISILSLMMFGILLLLIRPTLVIFIYNAFFPSASVVAANLSPGAYGNIRMPAILSFSNIFPERAIVNPNSSLGLLFPILAFLPLITLTKKDRRERMKVLLMSVICIVLITFLVAVRYWSDIPIVWSIVKYVPFRSQHMPQLYVWVLISALFALALEYLVKALKGVSISVDTIIGIKTKTIVSKSTFVTFVLCTGTLAAFFVYCPIYTRESHLAAQSLLQGQNEEIPTGTFAQIPDYYFSALDNIRSIIGDDRVLHIPNARSVESFFSFGEAIQYYTYTDPLANDLIYAGVKELPNPNVRLTRIFSLLNIKYIVILLDPTIEPEGYNEPWYGVPRVLNGPLPWYYWRVSGDTKQYADILSSSGFFTIVINSEKYVILEVN